jgi:hypothetical protein
MAMSIVNFVTLVIRVKARVTPDRKYQQPRQDYRNDCGSNSSNSLTATPRVKCPLEAEQNCDAAKNNRECAKTSDGREQCEKNEHDEGTPLPSCSVLACGYHKMTPNG